MAHTSPLSALHQIHSVAYAGTQFDVHLICETPSGELFPTQLTYGEFTRLLRERANRSSAIAVLDAFRRFAARASASQMHAWHILKVKGVLGHPLQIDPNQVDPTLLLHRAA